MNEYHAHEFPPCRDECHCKAGGTQPCSTIEYHPVADCDGTLSGWVRPLSLNEMDGLSVVSQ